MTPVSCTTSTNFRISRASGRGLEIKARGTSRGGGAYVWIQARIAARTLCRPRATLRRARGRFFVAGAGAARVEIPCRKKPNDSTPQGEKQDAQGDPVPRCSALFRKLDVHGPSFHNALSACFSALGGPGGPRLIYE